jgi:uncharacterized protein (TIGR00369 family)
MRLHPVRPINNFDLTLKSLKDTYHSQCIFHCNAPVDNLEFFFTEDGILMGEFLCSIEHQGYDGVVHGGIISAIIDASMAQCCMGHGFIAYTADLSIRYRKPVEIDAPCILETQIVSIGRRILFSLECRITQNEQLHVKANGRFFKGK